MKLNKNQNLKLSIEELFSTDLSLKWVDVRARLVVTC